MCLCYSVFIAAHTYVRAYSFEYVYAYVCVHVSVFQCLLLHKRLLDEQQPHDSIQPQ